MTSAEDRAAALISGWVGGDVRGEDCDQVREGDELELATREALFAVVEDLCAESVAVLVFDDLQWADRPPCSSSVARSAADLALLTIIVLATGVVIAGALGDFSM